MSDRFDFEQQLMGCWHIVDDIKLLNESVLEHPHLSKDKISNILLGLEELYDLKFQKLMDTFEAQVNSRKFT
jgi:hypothetical protein